MRARRSHSGTRAPPPRTHAPRATPAAARTAALCQSVSVRRVAGRGAGVRARARPHGAAARAVPAGARRRRRHRGGTQDGVRGVPRAAGGAPLELLRRRRLAALRTRHAHRDEGGGVHVRDHLGRRDARAERGVRARRPAGVPVHGRAAARRGGGRAVRVGRLRRGRVRRAAGAALPGRARAGARRARAHEPAQQPRRQEGGEGAGPARVQVPRRVGLLRHAHVLASTAALPRRRRRPARALRASEARASARPPPPRARQEAQAERGRGAGAAQVGAGVPAGVAVVLRARRRGGLGRHARAAVQRDVARRGRLRVAVLRARLQHAAPRAGDQVPLPLPLVLPRHLRHVRRARRHARLQVTSPCQPGLFMCAPI